jgi:hypothetical protein
VIRARAERDHARPVPSPTTVDEDWTLTVTVSALPEPNRDNRARVTDPIFAVLTTRELDVLLAVLGAGWRMTSAVHPTLCPLWQDTADLLGDLDVDWHIAFARENPQYSRIAGGS